MTYQTTGTSARRRNPPAHPGQLPFVFVVGCPRSGTTLLQRMLDNHPDLAVAYDTHFVPRALGRCRSDNPALTPELVARVRNHRRFPRLGVEPEVVEQAASTSSSYREFVAALYVDFASRHGKPLAGEKSPGYCRHIPRLEKLFPWARFVHLIRDGRDVTLSLLDWGKGEPSRIPLWREEPVAVGALWWLWKVQKGCEDGRALGGRYREVRFEALVRSPETELRQVSRFLGLPYADSMVRYHEGRRKHDAGLSAKAAWLPPTPGLRDWRGQMEARDVELFEALAGHLLSDLGYDRAFPRPSASLRETASRCADWWDRNFKTGSRSRRRRRSRAG